MAEKIKGITVEIGGNTTGLNNALKDVNKELGQTQSELKKVENLLKLDPSNIDLLKQKQELLSKSITDTENKIETLRKAKEQADQQMANGTEVNQEGYRALQREIASAEATLNKSKDAYKEVGEEIENAGKKARESSEGFTVFKGILANLGTQVINGVISGLARLGSAFVNLGKKAVENYSEMEQLAGGVETLFKESADTVKEYANNAYKTSGLNANEYMETVTSFSASLLQSLGGDTEEAARVADMAITDMADNANKMGTSMESIQNAYQGFAKQNYTMLDNLKLGYGGTKTEMERLLADAEKLSGVKYDISNLNDVYEAIHVIQTEMGITGTTAKEASQTIQGSAKAMKSAWENLVTGFADENANLEELMNQLTESAINLVSNLMPVVETIINQFPVIITALTTKLQENMPQILQTGQQLLQNLLNGILQNLPSIANSATQIIMMLTTVLIENLPQLLQIGLEVIVAIANGISESLPDLIPTIVDVMLEIVNTLIDNIDMLIDCALQLMIALADGLIEALPVLIEKVPTIILKLVGAIINMLPKLLDAGVQLIEELWNGAIKVFGTILTKIGETINKYIIQPIKDTVSKFTEVGKNLITGLWEGILNAKDWLYNKVKDFAQGIIEEIKRTLGIASPSKIMRDEVGKFMAQGIGVGFIKEMPSVIDEMKEKLGTAVGLLDTDLSLSDVNIKGHTLVSQNQNITKNYTQTTEIIRQPNVIELVMDGQRLGRALVPIINKENQRLGVKLV